MPVQQQQQRIAAALQRNQSLILDVQRPSTLSPLGFDPHFLADMLSPRARLCDRMFMLAVDDLVFVGHPTLVTGGGAEASAVPHPEGDVWAETCDVDSVVDPSFPPPLQKAVAPATSVAKKKESVAAAPAKSTSSTASINMFHVTFVFPSHVDRSLVRQVYELVLRPLTITLRYEQMHSQYVSRQVDLIVSLHDRALHAQRQAVGYNHHHLHHQQHSSHPFHGTSSSSSW